MTAILNDNEASPGVPFSLKLGKIIAEVTDLLKAIGKISKADVMAEYLDMSPNEFKNIKTDRTIIKWYHWETFEKKVYELDSKTAYRHLVSCFFSKL